MPVELVDVDVDAGTIELASARIEDFTNPSGNVLGAFHALREARAAG